MVRAGAPPRTVGSVRVVAFLCLVALVVLAGCNALPADTESEEPHGTVTPAPVPETGSGQGSSTAIARPVGTALPPGVSVDGSVNATELLCANNRILSNQSYTMVWSYVDRDTRSDVPTREGTTTTRVDDGRVRYDFGDPANTSNVTYVDRTGRYVRQMMNGTVTARYTNDTSPPVTTIPTFHLPFETELSPSNVSVSTVERDGETLYRVHVPEHPSPESYRRNYTATVYVAPSGVVQSLFVVDSTYVGEGRDRGETGNYSVVRDRYTVRAVGETTVSEPSWVRSLKRNVTTSNRTGPERYRYCDG